MAVAQWREWVAQSETKRCVANHFSQRDVLHSNETVVFEAVKYDVDDVIFSSFILHLALLQLLRLFNIYSYSVAHRVRLSVSEWVNMFPKPFVTC